MKIIAAIDRAFAKIEAAFLVTTLLFLLLFAFLQVMLRNLFDSGINWADVFNRLLVLWIGFFGATLAAKENRHLSLEVLTKFLPDKYKRIVDLLVSAFVVTITAILAYFSWLFFIDQITFESTDLLFEGLPKAYFTIIFPLGFALIALRYVFRFLETASGQVPQTESPRA